LLDINLRLNAIADGLILPSVPPPATHSIPDTSMIARVTSVLLLTALAAFAQVPDWPQFRGPKRDGVSTDKNLLKSWPTDGPPLAWKAEGVGKDGFSSVAIAATRSSDG
jgi:hypothetical protein